MKNKKITISFKYKNESTHAISEIKLYDGSLRTIKVLLLIPAGTAVDNDWKEYSFTLPIEQAKYDSYRIRIMSYTDDYSNAGIQISDLMMNYGDKQDWEMYNGESYSADIKFSGAGIEITSSNSKTKNFINTSGLIVYKIDSNGKITGTPLAQITASDDETAGLIASRISCSGDIINKKLVQTIINVNNIEYYVEYIK